MIANLVDFHCHLDLYPDFDSLMSDCDLKAIRTLTVTTTPKAWPRNRDLASVTKHIRVALGLHPQVVSERAREFNLWREYLPQSRYVGEVGLDAGPKFYNSFDVQKQVSMPVEYYNHSFENAYRLDLWVNKKVIIEVKAVEKILPVHEAQILSYMRLSKSPLGLLINFNEKLLKDGIKRYALTEIKERE